MKTNGYKITANGETAEILIYDVIGSGFYGGLTAKAFVQDLATHNALTNIKVRLNSPGGEVFDGTAIYNALQQHPANIEVQIDGMALSMASVIAMAGNTVTMAENSMMMIHDPSISAAGNANSLRKSADLLDKTKDSILSAYMRKTGKSSEEISALMSVETWMSAQEALEHGFIDSITESVKMTAHFDLQSYGFKRIPNNLVTATTAQTPVAQVTSIPQAQQSVPESPTTVQQPTTPANTVELATKNAVEQERQRIQNIIEIANTLNQPQMAMPLIQQGANIETARQQIFGQAAYQQAETPITSQVNPLPVDASNPLIEDAQKRAKP